MDSGVKEGIVCGESKIQAVNQALILVEAPSSFKMARLIRADTGGNEERRW